MMLCFYSPYLTNHHSGGGERHLFDTAVAAAMDHKVYVSISLPRTLSSRTIAERAETDLSTSLHSAQDNTFLERTKCFYERFLGYSLKNIEFIPSPLNTEASFLEKLMWTKQYDGLYYVTDGSLFFSLAKKNYLHIQIPFTQSKHSLVERIKLWNWHHKNTNSEFTKKHIEQNWQTHVDLIHYPLVDTSEFDPSTKKEKIILSVGRFFTQLHAKRQDITIEIFKQFLQTYPALAQGWKLVLAGSVEDQEFFKQLQKQAEGLPVEFYTKLNRGKLVDLFNTSSFYVHSAGFNIDEEKSPEKVEHFGITTLEAMAAGCIPLAHNKGGQREILSGELQKLLWKGKEEAIEKLTTLINDKKASKKLQVTSKKRAGDFGQEQFNHRVEKMFF